MLEPSFSRAYHLAMTFDFLLRAIARLLPAKQQARADCGQDIEDDKAWDPENPFPEVVMIEFGDVLDLHSIPPRQVRAVVEDYLAEAHRRGATALRIIHGKGVGVQREIVRSILASLPYVIEYRDAPSEAGGWGATLVTLESSGPADDAESDSGATQRQA
ncbi:MAG TPA: Smr/MutS family protein [Blastocatellia bacterium]|nr:Smr/MutS family protein [Blastocatellia bacterium]